MLLWTDFPSTTNLVHCCRDCKARVTRVSRYVYVTTYMTQPRFGQSVNKLGPISHFKWSDKNLSIRQILYTKANIHKNNYFIFFL